jgi:cell division protein FtsB
MINFSSNPAMKLLLQLPSWLRNKYFISFAAFAVWMLFFDEKDIFTMSHHRQELRVLQQSKEYYTAEINKEETELQNLKNNPATLEKYAREKYYMKRDNEDIFLIPENQH